MKKWISSLLILIILNANAITVGGIKLPDEWEKDGIVLKLNGAGLRKKMIIKVYAAGLYLMNEISDSNEIINLDEPMAIKMHFIYKNVSKEKLIDAWKVGFTKFEDKNDIALEISKFNSFFTHDAKKGDIYDFIYIPRKGVDVFYNNEFVGTVGGFTFKKALFSIWLAESTTLPKLRKALLGL